MDFYFTIGLAVLLETVKSAKKRAELKKQFAKVVRTIITQYGNDAEFRVMAGLTQE